MLTDLWYRLRAIVLGRRMDDDARDELRFHLDCEIEKLVASGLTPESASREAHRRLGGLAQTADACRDARGISLVETTLQDLKFGVRMLRRTPTFAIAAMATIALSVAAIATVATLGNTLLWRSVRVDRPGTLVSVSATRGRPGDAVLSYPDYVSFRDRVSTVEGLAAHYSVAPLFVSAGGNAKEVNGAVVSANYFLTLGVQPERGRFFSADEDRVPDRDRVAIIGHDFWRTWLGSPETAVGSSLTINGVPFTIIGIAPERVPALTPLPVNVYIPTMQLRVGYRWCDDALSAKCTMLMMVGRLAPGRTIEEANTEFAALLPPAWRTAPIGQNRGIVVRRPRGMSDDDSDPEFVATLAGAALLLWLVCCVNLAGLLTAQSSARETEFAVRVSLGAGRFRLVRQIVTESVLVSAIGGALGVLLSQGFVSMLSAMFFAFDDEGHALFYDFGQTTPIVIGTIAAAIVAGVIFSLVPAMKVVRRPGAPTATRVTAGRWSTTRWLLGAQAAAAVALVATAALLAASARLVLVGRNYDTSHVALMRVRPRLLHYSPDRAQQFQRDAIARLADLPFVQSVTMVGIGSVLSGGSAAVTLPEWRGSAPLQVHYNEIGPAYFATVRTPILAGREFDHRDTVRSAPVAIVNQTLADRLWPAGRPLDAAVSIDGVPHRVVGVVANASLEARDRAPEAWIYSPFWQNAGQIDSRIAVRVSGDPAAALALLEREVHKVDPAVPIAETMTLSSRMAGLTRPVRVGAVFVGYAATLAMFLTALGLYGSLASTVLRRTKEIGIRVALGAGRRQLVGAIVGEGLTVVAVGSVAGIALAIGASRAIIHLLYGSASIDWIAYLSAALGVMLVGALASLVPARRAAGIEPIAALRQE